MAETINPTNNVETNFENVTDNGVIEEGLNGLEDTVVKGNIGFAEDFNDMADRTLKDARNVLVEGDLTARTTALEDAWNTVIEGDILHTNNIGFNSENVRLLGDIQNARKTFSNSENIRIHGELDNAGNVFNNADNSHIRGDVDGMDIMTSARNSSIHGDVSGVNHVLRGAESSKILGNASGIDLMREAKNSVIYGNIEARDNLMPDAENSIVVGEKIKAGNSIGFDSENSILIAREVESDKIDENLQLITADKDLRGPTYDGELNRLFKFVEDKVDKIPAILEIFDLNSDYSNFNQLREDIEKLEEWHTEEISDTYKTLKEFDDYIDIGLPESNKDRVDYLEEEEKALVESFQNSWDIDEDQAREVEGSVKRQYLAKILSKTDTDKIPEAPDDDFQSWFLDNFYTADEKPEEHLLELEDGTYDFEVEERLDYIEIDNELDENHQKDLYDQGISLLEEIMEGERRYELDEDEIEEIEEVQEADEELENKIEDLERLRSNIETGEDYQRLSGELNSLEKEIEELEKDKIQSFVEYQAESFDVDLENPERGNLQTILNQVKQHALTERHQTWEKARYLVEELEAEPEEITSNEVKISYWDKTGMIPSSSEYQCCAFEGGVKSKELPYWLADPNTQFMEIETGTKKGMAVTRLAEGKKGDYMIVDTVESAHSNIFKSEELVGEVSNAIDDFAEKVETEIEGIVYNRSPHNSAARQFISNMAEKDYEIQEFNLSQKRENVYSEVNFEELNGYLKKF